MCPRATILAAVLATCSAYTVQQVPQVMQTRMPSSVVMMAKKKKNDDRTWLPQRSSPFAREVDVALQLVSRAAAGLEKASSIELAGVAAQALIGDGLRSEFPEDGLVAAVTAEASSQQAVLELVNEIGATTPCVNEFEPPYPVPVPATALTEETLQTTLAKGGQEAIGPRTWLLAPIAEATYTAISLTLLEFGQPVVCAVAMPSLPRTSIGGEKLLRMTVSFDGQAGAVPPPGMLLQRAPNREPLNNRSDQLVCATHAPARPPPRADGTILWAEQNIGSYERNIGGEHGTDVRVQSNPIWRAR